jgi:hypothetical protein
MVVPPTMKATEDDGEGQEDREGQRRAADALPER